MSFRISKRMNTLLDDLHGLERWVIVDSHSNISGAKKITEELADKNKGFTYKLTDAYNGIEIMKVTVRECMDK